MRTLGVTGERLREVLDYNSETGVFRWRVVACRRMRAGDVAGSISSNGYRTITIDYTHYKASRLAWLYVTCEWPAAGIDHVNLDRADDRFCNLRHATQSENMANTRAYANNSSGFKGVHWDPARSKWRAQIKANGERIHLGSFHIQEDAAAAYAAAAAQYFGEYARTE